MVGTSFTAKLYVSHETCKDKEALEKSIKETKFHIKHLRSQILHYALSTYPSELIEYEIQCILNEIEGESNALFIKEKLRDNWESKTNC